MKKCRKIYVWLNSCKMPKDLLIWYNRHFMKIRDITRDEDPDPVGSVDFWPAGSDTFFSLDPDPDPTCYNGCIKSF